MIELHLALLSDKGTPLPVRKRTNRRVPKYSWMLVVKALPGTPNDNSNDNSTSMIAKRTS